MATRRDVHATRQRGDGRRTQRRQSARGWLTRIRAQPVPARAIEGAALVGLLALLYLSQVAAVDTTNSQLQTLQTRQTSLRRADEQAHAQLAQAQSVATIDRRARALGLQPAAPGAIIVVTSANGGGR